MNQLLTYLKGDRVIWTVSAILALLSIVIVYSSASQLVFRFQNGHSERYLFKHIFILLIGFGAMIYTHRLNFKYFSKLSQLGLWLSCVLLVLTFFLGTSVNSAQRWLFGFQPSDLAKLSLIIFVARKLSINQSNLNDFRKGIVPILIPIFIVCGLILPSDLSTSAMLFVDCFILLLIGGLKLKHMLLVMAICLAALLMIVATSKVAPNLVPRFSTWTSRIESFFEKDKTGNDDYQVNIAKQGIKEGGIFGKGPGKSVTKHVLPSAWADFIFVSFIEEYGSLIGGIGLIILYLILMFRAVRISIKSKSKFGSFIAFGLGFSIVFQAFLNMGVGVNLLPVTGQPLPLVSMGGTSILFTCIALGIILSVSKSFDNNQKGGEHETS